MTSEPQIAPQEILDEVEKEYEKTLIIPTTKPSPQWMLLPVGLIGAGKSTVVKPLAERLNLIRLCTDDVRKLLKDHGYRYDGARDVIMNLLNKYLEQGYSVALDANTGSVEGLKYNAKSKERFPNVRQVFIHINPPEEYILNKLRNYKHTWLFEDGESAVEQYLKNKHSFSLPDLHFVYTFDPSSNDFQEQLKEGATALEKAAG